MKKKKRNLTTILFVIAILLGAVLLGSCSSYQIAFSDLTKEQQDRILDNAEFNNNYYDNSANWNPYLWGAGTGLWLGQPRWNPYWNSGFYTGVPHRYYRTVPRAKTFRTRPNNVHPKNVRPRSSAPRSRSGMRTAPRRAPKQPMGRKK